MSMSQLTLLLRLPRNDVSWTCKHCGEQLSKRRYGGRHACIRNRIFNALCDHPHGLTSFEIASVVYANDPNGGCLWAHRSIAVRVLWMNREWEKQGRSLRIHSKGYGGLGNKYRIWIVK